MAGDAEAINRRGFLTFSVAMALELASSDVIGGSNYVKKPSMVQSSSDASKDITLFLCGDVMTGRGIDQVLPHPSNPRLCESHVKTAGRYVDLAVSANGPIPKPVDFPYIWGDALAELDRERPDLRLINLETSVTVSEECLPKGINYRMHPANVACLTAASIDCCVLANNHVLDWGRAGLEETLKTLEGAQIKTAGAGRDGRDAEAPAIFDILGKGRVIVFAFGAGTSGIPQDWAARKDRPGVSRIPDLSHRSVQHIAERTRAEKQPGDIVVASIHWGPNWGYDVPGEQRTFAHGLIDFAGVDIVHGHSSHHPKGFELYKGKSILYGCGDFLNDYEGIAGYEEFRDDLTLMYFATLDPETGRLVRMSITPLRIKNFRLNRPTADEVRWLHNRLNREYEQFGTGVKLQDGGRFRVQPR